MAAREKPEEKQKKRNQKAKAVKITVRERQMTAEDQSGESISIDWKYWFHIWRKTGEEGQGDRY